MAWFAEELRLGKWRPMKYDQRPPAKSQSGFNTPRRALVEIPDYFDKLTLDQLQEVLGPEGRFRNTGGGTPTP